jgi:hypothetical protein
MMMIIFCGLVSVANVYSKDIADIQKADAHFHLLDFLQNSDHLSKDLKVYTKSSPYFTPQAGDRGGRIRAALYHLDRSNVKYTTVFGMPFIKKWSRNAMFRSSYYLDSSSRVKLARDTDYVVALAIQDFMASGGSVKDRERLFPFIGGFDSTDLGAVDMVVKRIKEFPSLWEGIGEVMSRHDDLTNLTTGERPIANHPAIHRLSDFAGKYYLPVSIHHNIAPVSPSGQIKKPYYLAEFKKLLDAHSRTVFIWCHAGISRRINVGNLTQVIDDFLSENKRHKHVYIDLSWVVFDDYIYSKKKGIDNRKDWAKLLSKYPKTFMFGSDKVGKFKGYDVEVNKYGPFIDVLMGYKNGETLATNFLEGNFVVLMKRLRKKRGGLGVVLKPDYVYPETKFVSD